MLSSVQQTETSPGGQTEWGVGRWVGGGHYRPLLTCSVWPPGGTISTLGWGGGNNRGPLSPTKTLLHIAFLKQHLPPTAHVTTVRVHAATPLPLLCSARSVFMCNKPSDVCTCDQREGGLFFFLFFSSSTSFFVFGKRKRTVAQSCSALLRGRTACCCCCCC